MSDFVINEKQPPVISGTVTISFAAGTVQDAYDFGQRIVDALRNEPPTVKVRGVSMEHDYA